MIDGSGRMIVVSLTLSTALVAIDAEAVVLCKKRSGALSIREACKRKETQVDPATAGVVGPRGAAAPTVRVIDTNGATVGDVTNIFGTLGFNVAGGVVVVAATPNGIRQGAIYAHAMPGCAGPRYVVEFEPYGLTHQAQVEGTVAYHATDPLQEVGVFSEESDTPDPICSNRGGTILPNGFCCEDAAYTGIGSLPSMLDLSRFVPPFHAEAAP
jgi:hypothetical protein